MGPWLNALLILCANAVAIWLIACLSLLVMHLRRREK